MTVRSHPSGLTPRPRALPDNWGLLEAGRAGTFSCAGPATPLSADCVQAAGVSEAHECP